MESQIKLLTIGDSAVGKTCLLLRYASDSFQTTFITTIGIDFKTKHINIDGRQVLLLRAPLQPPLRMTSDV